MLFITLPLMSTAKMHGCYAYLFIRSMPHTHTHTQHAFEIKLHMSPERNLILAIHTHTYNEHETHSNYASGDCKRHSISSTPIDDDILLPTYMNTLS